MSKAAFFRQSAWMVLATVASGVFMFAVHLFSKKIPEAEYAILGTLLAGLNCMAIPTIALQMWFAHDAAVAVTPERDRQLIATLRTVLLGTTLIGLALLVGLWAGQHSLMAMWKIANPMALWAAGITAVCNLWVPPFLGLLQGRQNFLWLGWANVLNGLTRLSVVALVVFGLNAVTGGSFTLAPSVAQFLGTGQLGIYAGGIMLAALAGTLAALAVAVWQSRQAWRGTGEAWDWRPALSRLLPLSLGFGASQFLFSADPLFVQNYFDKDVTHAYMAVGTLCRALVTFVGPLASVMFPKVAHSRAKSEQSDLLRVTLLLTGGLATLGALGLSVLAPLILRIVFKESFLADGVPLMRWFGWALVPLALANVLMNHLLAHASFRAVPWLVAVACGYALALTFFHGSFLVVVATLGAFSLLFLAVTAFFTWRDPRPPTSAEPATAATELSTTSKP